MTTTYHEPIARLPGILSSKQSTFDVYKVLEMPAISNGSKRLRSHEAGGSQNNSLANNVMWLSNFNAGMDSVSIAQADSSQADSFLATASSSSSHVAFESKPATSRKRRASAMVFQPFTLMKSTTPNGMGMLELLNTRINARAAQTVTFQPPGMLSHVEVDEERQEGGRGRSGVPAAEGAPVVVEEGMLGEGGMGSVSTTTAPPVVVDEESQEGGRARRRGRGRGRKGASAAEEGPVVVEEGILGGGGMGTVSTTTAYPVVVEEERQEGGRAKRRGRGRGRIGASATKGAPIVVEEGVLGEGGRGIVSSTTAPQLVVDERRQEGGKAKRRGRGMGRSGAPAAKGAPVVVEEAMLGEGGMGSVSTTTAPPVVVDKERQEGGRARRRGRGKSGAFAAKGALVVVGEGILGEEGRGIVSTAAAPPVVFDKERQGGGRAMRKGRGRGISGASAAKGAPVVVEEGTLEEGGMGSVSTTTAHPVAVDERRQEEGKAKRRGRGRGRRGASVAEGALVMVEEGMLGEGGRGGVSTTGAPPVAVDEGGQERGRARSGVCAAEGAPVVVEEGMLGEGGRGRESTTTAPPVVVDKERQEGGRARRRGRGRSDASAAEEAPILVEEGGRGKGSICSTKAPLMVADNWAPVVVEEGGRGGGSTAIVARVVAEGGMQVRGGGRGKGRGTGCRAEGALVVAEEGVQGGGRGKGRGRKSTAESALVEAEEGEQGDGRGPAPGHRPTPVVEPLRLP
eukprot:gene17967-24372_t